jgi:hypothetical protein
MKLCKQGPLRKQGSWQVGALQIAEGIKPFATGHASTLPLRYTLIQTLDMSRDLPVPACRNNKEFR